MSIDAATRPAQLTRGPVATKLNVTVTGPEDGPVVLFAHGFGCDQGMWDGVVPHFADDHRVVRYDLMGYGQSDFAAYDPVRYSSLDGHADDILGIVAELDLRDVTLVSHSVSTMMAVKAAIAEPGRFRQLVLVAANPYFLQDPAAGYDGGFSDADMTEVAGALDSNYFTWAEAMAPVIMGTPDSPEHGERLTASFCRVNPDVARQLLGMMFTTDYRPLLPQVTTPTVVLQGRGDAMVPPTVAWYLRDHLPGAILVQLEALGHCPHISAPEETAAAIRAHLLRP